LFNAYLHLTTLVLAAVAATAAWVAVWAAVSRRHWFWRAVAVWACSAALLPIRVYEPALVFAMSLPATALAIRSIQWWWERSDNAMDSPGRASRFRFGLRDVLLSMALLGLVLAMLLQIPRPLPSLTTGPRTIQEFIVPAIAMTVIAVLAWCLVSVRVRGAATLSIIVALPGFAWALWPSTHWLFALDSDLSLYFSLSPTDQVDRRGFLLTLFGLSEYAALFTALIVASSLYAQARAWRIFCRGALAVACGGLALLYWLMLHLTPFPPGVVTPISHYSRIVEIAQRVEAINEKSLSSSDVEKSDESAGTELRDLYGELLPLLELPNPPGSLVADLSSEKARRIREQTEQDRLHAVRILGRALAAESKAAAARDEGTAAANFALAGVRLGMVYRQNGLLIDALLSRAMMSISFHELASCRQGLDEPSAKFLIAALRNVEDNDEPPTTLIARDMAYCERVYGWQCRLSNVIQRLTDGEPTKWEQHSKIFEAQTTWFAVNRLLQTDLAIRCFQKEHGHWPDRVIDIIPYLSVPPLDPFTDWWLVYRHDDDGFTLYSVGHDRQDNGGRFSNLRTYHYPQTYGEPGQGYDLDLDTLTRP